MRSRLASGLSTGRAAAPVVLALVLTSDGLAVAGDRDIAPALGAEHGAGAVGAELEDLAWIAGHWEGEAFGGQMEEAWLGPAGRSLTGQFRLVRGDVAIMYELLLIEQDDDGEIYYRFKHIGRGWTPQEETRLEYRLTELDGRRATFRSTASEPIDGAPWWFTYESPTAERLEVAVYGADGGDPIVLSMTRR